MDECPDAMTTTFLFNKTLEQARLLGAQGGRAYARNLRRRKQPLSMPAAAQPVSAPPSETVAEAILRLDAGFAWLKGAERSPVKPSTKHQKRHLGEVRAGMARTAGTGNSRLGAWNYESRIC